MKKLIALIVVLVAVLTVFIGIGVKMIKDNYTEVSYAAPVESVLIEADVDQLPEKNIEIENNSNQSVIEEKEKSRITISAAGDCTLGYSAKQSTWNRFDTVFKTNTPDYFFENVRTIFEDDDLTIVNLEGPLTRLGTPVEKEFVFRGEPEYVHILTSSSVEAVNLANNHTRDYGDVGYDETQKVLKEAGIGFFGEQTVFYHTINDIRVGLIGMKGWSSDKWVKDNLTRLISEAKLKSDLIIVMFHWGVEGTYYPVAAQKDLAKHAIDEGAHLILGSHPHVIQGIEKYKERNIVYSMGNFCFGGNRNPSDKDTFIYQETFERTETGIVSVGSQVIPCRISSVETYNDYRPTPLQGDAKRIVEERLETYSQIE
ncbi:CapA family protein [Cellulosilyticum sp. I15G10I2]|uniref:CapA family protein n=1 Tax=Cellulosilyticum sp. I15G10I2 TaxID=1892843 RepID=UPI00085BE289|nr:CapA family protein [Cellulosilyticum sp. I15G10I2]